jgi:hypothetical protein
MPSLQIATARECHARESDASGEAELAQKKPQKGFHKIAARV